LGEKAKLYEKYLRFEARYPLHYPIESMVNPARW